MGFDLAKYQEKEEREVDIKQTRTNVGVFLKAYFSARSRVGQPREPKLSATLSIVPPSTNNAGYEAEQILIENEEAIEEFNELHDLFVKGMAAIEHPFKPDIAERRKKIFYSRYVAGQTIYLTAQNNHISEETVKQESSLGIEQFADSMGIVAYKNIAKKVRA